MTTKLLCASTTLEIQPTLTFLQENAKKLGFSSFEYGADTYEIMITGVGSLLTGYALAKFFRMQTVDLAIQIGIAGAFNRQLKLGEVVQVTQEQLADLGIEEADGTFVDLFELGLARPNMGPFQNGQLNWKGENPSTITRLSQVSGITVNTVSGWPSSIAQIQSKYPVDIETMESGAFFYACLSDHVPFIALRSISNYVEERTRDQWEIDKAVQSVNDYMIEMIQGSPI